MAQVIAQRGWDGSDDTDFLVWESEEFAVIVGPGKGFVSDRMHPAVLTKGGYWEDVTDLEGAEAALAYYAEHPPTRTIPLYRR